MRGRSSGRGAAWLWAAALLCPAAVYASGLRVAVFRADATPKPGEPLIWTTPAKTIHDPLLAKGVVIDTGRERIVLCALDWCGLGNRAHALLRSRLAEAAGTDISHVALHTVHQHTAPYVDASAYDLLERLGAGIPRFSDASLEDVAGRIGAAAREAVARLEPFDRVGTSAVRVAQVASARRLKGADGKLATRYSTSGSQRAMAEAPEGDIDPYLRTVTLASGTRVLVRLHYYATHPQTFCCEGTVTSDIAGAAREAMEREQGIPQIYFTGAAGDVTVGKYNDGSTSARERLTANLLAALRQAPAATNYAAVKTADWSNVPLTLPKKAAAPVEVSADPDTRYKRAIAEVFAARTEPLTVAAVHLGPAYIVLLPGEPMLAFQKYALALRPGDFVALAGYGDIAPGYICTNAAYAEGGYEPGASNSGPGAESALKAAIRAALGPERAIR